MFKKNENTPENDKLQEGFAGMDRYITAPADLKAAAKSGLPLQAMRETRKARTRRLTRVVTAYAMIVVLLVGVVFAMPYFEADEPVATTTENTTAVMELPYMIHGDRVLPASRTGKGMSYGSIAADYATISLIYEASDAVARVRIGNWLDENQYETYYQAEVIEVYKGTLPEEIIIQQDGTSRATFSGYPLFFHGEEKLIFLKKTDISDFASPEEAGPYTGTAYWIPGSYMGVFDCTTDDTGELYFADCFNALNFSGFELTDYSNDSTVVSQVYTQLDSVYKRKIQGIYLVSELIDCLNNSPQ